MTIRRRDIIISGALAGALAFASGPVFADEFKAAIVMPGNITDQSWNQTGYEGIMRAKETLGIVVAYSEKVTQPDQLEAMSDYARRGYNVVIGHGGEFVDAAERASERFPDTMFVVTNGFVSKDNLASVTFDFKQFGYVLGFLGGKMSKAGTGGYVSAQKIQVATDLEAGFKEGFQSVHPDAEIFVSYTNDWDDVAKAKEAARNQFDEGADVVFPLLDNGQIGALQAAKEAGGWSFGVWQDVYENWPDTVLQSAVMDFRIALVDFLALAKDGKAEGKVYKFGIGTDAGTLGTYNPSIPEDVVNETEAVIEKLKSGELKL
ncbi:MAG TPA: BMP family protein [Armatimonadota bacterium]|nr:BMP family protein [Armatimonadota bacterium]